MLLKMDGSRPESGREIERDARALDGNLELPGVEITSDYAVAARGARWAHRQH